MKWSVFITLIPAKRYIETQFYSAKVYSFVELFSINIQRFNFRPNQHLSNKGIKQNKFSENCIDRLLAYSTTYYDMASA